MPTSTTIRLPVLLLLLMTVGRPVAAQDTLRDDFTGYPPGSDGGPAWLHNNGLWYMNGDRFCETSGAYDTGAFLPRFYDRPYDVSVQVRIDGTYRGAGVFFNSASPTSADYTHMVRMDGEQVIFGYFEGTVYFGLGDAALPEALKDGAWHTMNLRVHPAEGTFAFGFDESWLREDVPLRFKTGYMGLQNSGGPACFDNFELRLDRDSVQPASTAPGLAAAWPKAVAPAPDGGVWIGSDVSGRVTRLSPEGAVRAALNGGYEHRPFAGPTALATLPDGDLVVLDAGAVRLHRFDSEGRWQATAGSSLQAPADLAAWPDGTLAVSDSEARTVVFFDSTLAPIGRLGALDLEPGAVAAAPGRLAVADRDAGYVHVFTGAGTDWTEHTAFALPPGASRGLALTDEHLFVAHDNRILRYDHDGRLTRQLALDMMHQVYPQRLAVHGPTLYIADYFGNRIVVADTALTNPNLTHTFTDDGSLDITWTSGLEAPGRVEVRTEDGLWAEQTADQAASTHHVRFDGVQPATLYRIRYAPLLHTIPPAADLSREVVAMSPPPNGKTPYVNLQSAVLLFTNVVDETKAAAWPEPSPLPEDETDRILAQIEDGRRYFWLNSGMRLNLDLDYFVVDEPLTRGDLFEDLSYYPPVDGKARDVLAARGADLDDYESIYYLVVVRDYDAETETWDLRGPGGAFTNGLGWNGAYGRSWWEVTRRGHPAGNNWLVVHEFHHQLDELFLLSGYPEYWFNHFSPHIGTSADFGEHFDGNAYLLRTWPADAWFDLDYGTLALADDADMDGIPDDAPDLPMDENRLGSDPGQRDSDGDGVTDLEETTVSNWITEGWGETYAAPARFPDLTDPDSDGDGLRDGEDPAPLVPFSREIAPLASGFTRIGGTEDGRAPYQVDAAWSPDSLVLRIELPEGRPVRILLDANADGWFSGRDNVEFRLETGAAGDARVTVFHAGRADRWATADPDLAASFAYTWRRLGEGRYQLSIPRAPTLGLALEAGEPLGLNIGVALPDFARGRERYLTFHEPNRSLKLRLAAPAGSSP